MGWDHARAPGTVYSVRMPSPAPDAGEAARHIPTQLTDRPGPLFEVLRARRAVGRVPAGAGASAGEAGRA